MDTPSRPLFFASKLIGKRERGGVFQDESPGSLAAVAGLPSFLIAFRSFNLFPVRNAEPSLTKRTSLGLGPLGSRAARRAKKIKTTQVFLLAAAAAAARSTSTAADETLRKQQQQQQQGGQLVKLVYGDKYMGTFIHV